MRRVLLTVIGAVVTLLGLLWAGQGSGLIGGSAAMSGQSRWLVIGIVVAVVGVALIVLGNRGVSARPGPPEV